LNEKEVVRLLRRYAPVRIVEFTASTPVAEQLRIMASTGVLVGAHTSALANCVFLPPGAAVVELIHRNWAWDNMDRSFKVHSEAAGDKHHWAWRATARHHSVFINPRDEMRFGGDEWAGEKCDTDECVEAHTNVDVVVDIKALERLLEDTLPAVWDAVPVEEAELPWPSA
jgi:protein O-GlcNAc transferase